MKKIILTFLCFITCLSCQSQDNKINLKETEFSKNYKEILKNTKFQTDPREIVTTLPIAYTKDVNLYKFGDISFVKSNDNELKSSTVGLLINNTTERLTKGLKIEIEDTAIGHDLLLYLKSEYKNLKTLSGIPKKNSEGKLLGNSAYSCYLKDKTIVFVQYYEYTDDKPNISSILYIVDNKVLATDFEETVASHLIKTFTP